MILIQMKVWNMHLKQYSVSDYRFTLFTSKIYQQPLVSGDNYSHDFDSNEGLKYASQTVFCFRL